MPWVCLAHNGVPKVQCTFGALFHRDDLLLMTGSFCDSPPRTGVRSLVDAPKIPVPDDESRFIFDYFIFGFRDGIGLPMQIGCRGCCVVA